jgi:hypothetical protein
MTTTAVTSTYEPAFCTYTTRRSLRQPRTAEFHTTVRSKEVTAVTNRYKNNELHFVTHSIGFCHTMLTINTIS